MMATNGLQGHAYRTRNIERTGDWTQRAHHIAVVRKYSLFILDVSLMKMPVPSREKLEKLPFRNSAALISHIIIHAQ